MKIGSLFAGIGGLELGLEWAGVGHTVWQVEQNEYAQRVLAKHWPAARRYDDVRTVGAHNLEPVDVLCGGFPCQDVSLAGAGAGLDGERSGLWFEYARLVGELRPRFVVVENVSALLSRGADRVLGTLAALGYGAWWTTLRAADVGAPHLRERWFCVAYADGLRQPQPRGRLGDERRRTGDRGAVAVAHSPRERDRGAQHEVRAGRNAAERGGSLAHAHGRGLGAGQFEVRAGEPDAEGGSECVGQADADCARLEVGERIPGDAGAQRSTAPRGRARRGTRSAEPRVGRGADGLSGGLDGTRWPAGRGEAQHSWEAPRAAHGVPNRPARLKALGNAVVPQCAYVIGRVLLAIDEELRAAEAA